ncbi:MAG: triose-phosphate isomerase [Phycisphaerales bacterium]|nr:triose-phosphate isomerase [Phycisphaerales bacterium]
MPPVQRTPLIAGNWKMNLDCAGAVALARDVARHAAGARVDVAVFPAFVHLDAVQRALRADGLALTVGAQDCSDAPNGALTGEVSLAMLQDLGCNWVLTGHSERRHVIGESDDVVAAKTAAALRASFTCVLCIGEKLEQRERGETDTVNERQLRAALKGLDAQACTNLVIAYEPVWAIGTGRVASAADAQAAHHAARRVLSDILGRETAARTRILYGGSLKASNAGELLAMADVDGGLVGGASLEAGGFGAIIDAAAGLAHSA